MTTATSVALWKHLLIIGMLALVVVASSQAARPSPDPSVHVGTAPGLEPPRFLAGLSKSCEPRALYNRRQYKNVAGRVLWEYIQQVYYCTSDGFVTYFYRTRFARVPSVTPIVNWTAWEFDGNQNSNCSGEHCFIRNAKARKRNAWTQGKFHVCLVLDRLVCNYALPELSMTVYGTGGYSGWTKG